MSTSMFLDVLIVGLSSGACYGIMAVGLTLVYGVTNLLNYAHGSFFTWGAYIAWLLANRFLRLNYFAAFALTIPIMCGVGFVFERLIIHPLRRLQDWEFTAIIVTLGAALLLDHLALVTFGPQYLITPPLLEGIFQVGNYVIAKHDVVILLALVGIVVFLTFFLEKTRPGMSMRAVAQDATGAEMVGIPINRMYTYVFLMSVTFAAISGILLTPKTLIFPSVGWGIFMKSFVIVVFGGLGSIKGTIYAAFILGITEAFVTYYWGGMWAMPIFLAVLLIVMIFRPKGLFGRW